MFTSANVAAARLSVLEDEACFASNQQSDYASSHRGLKLAKGSKSAQLGSSLMSVAALISKLDEEQPVAYESSSSPTLRLQPLKKPEEALQKFLERVEAARLKGDQRTADWQSWAPVTEEFSKFEETDTLDNIPCQIMETRRSAYKTLAKRTFNYLNFERADTNRFNTSTEQLVISAQKANLPERVMIRWVNGVAFHAPGWTLSTADDKDPASLLKACRTAAEVKVSFHSDSTAVMNQEVSASKNQLLLEAVSINSGSVAAQKDDLAGQFITRLISELLDVAGSHKAEQHQLPEAYSLLEMSLCTESNYSASSPVNAMEAVTGLALRHF